MSKRALPMAIVVGVVCGLAGGLLAGAVRYAWHNELGIGIAAVVVLVPGAWLLGRHPSLRETAPANTEAGIRGAQGVMLALGVMMVVATGFAAISYPYARGMFEASDPLGKGDRCWQINQQASAGNPGALESAREACYPTYERASRYAAAKRMQVGLLFFFASAAVFLGGARGLRRRQYAAQSEASPRDG